MPPRCEVCGFPASAEVQRSSDDKLIPVCELCYDTCLKNLVEADSDVYTKTERIMLTAMAQIMNHTIERVKLMLGDEEGLLKLDEGLLTTIKQQAKESRSVDEPIKDISPLCGK